MDAKKVMNIVKQFNEGILQLLDASLALILLGCSAEEVQKLLRLDTELILGKGEK